MGTKFALYIQGGLKTGPETHDMQVRWDCLYPFNYKFTKESSSEKTF